MQGWTRTKKAIAAAALVAAGFGGGAAVMVAGPVAADSDRATSTHRGEDALTGDRLDHDLDAGSVTTEEQLVALVQDAYGEAGLGLHRGHQPIEDVLDEVLAISHDELHSRMDRGQNLAVVAEDLGVEPQALVDALVESRTPAIDALVEDGTLTRDEAGDYRQALEEAFDFRTTWDGEAATPSFTGI